MKRQTKCGTGHGMPAEPSPEVAKRIAEQEQAKRKKQAEDFAKDSLPTKATKTVTVHESKHFPFQVIEITFINENAQTESKEFRIGMCGEFVSEKGFHTHEKAEKYIASRPWELITNMVCVTIKNAIDYEKSQSKH